MMETSENISELAIALAKAQAAMTNPKKNSENPFFRSSYAQLDEVCFCQVKSVPLR